MKMRLTLTALCCCFAATAFAADVYKWKDAQGRVHYGDQAKQGSKKINASPAPAEAPADADAKAQRAKKVAECGRKRDQLMTYQNATRIVEKDALGNEKDYSDADRLRLIQVTQKQIADQCADVPAAPESAASKPAG